MYVAAASSDIQQQAEESGEWDTLIKAGTKMLPPGCGPCIGLGTGFVEDGEVAISATNRNFKGRMGSRDAQVYLGLPAVVAASAKAGYICAPESYEDIKPVVQIRTVEQALPQMGGVMVDGFPRQISGRVVLLPVDNLNTDGIYTRKWTYRDDLTLEQMKAVTFENYDPQLGGCIKPGDILVVGQNFGTGSSREQAATALQAARVVCVIAASFSETYRRNAFNNGLLCIEAPLFYEALVGLSGVSSCGTGGAERFVCLGSTLKWTLQTTMCVATKSRFRSCL